MKYMANERFLDRKAFGPVVGLTRSGIPTIVPIAWRRSLQSGNLWIARFILTIFGLYRVLDFRGKFTIKTIVDPWTGALPVGIVEFIPRFLAMLDFKFPDMLRWHPIPILSRSPTSPPADRERGVAAGTAMRGFGPALCAIFGSPLESHLKDYSDVVGLGGQFRMIRSIWNEAFNSTHTDFKLGKLSLKHEPGKVRVFAQVDIITQWFLYPLHMMLFAILRNIREDATFDQNAGVEKVRAALAALPEGKRFVFSFDLSAATDRLPVVLQVALLNAMKQGLGTAWAAILTDRDYWLLSRDAPEVKMTREPIPVRYAVGQPMGAYSSWAMLALTHHLIVQFAAWSLGHNSWFRAYMVLGDDIVIYDRDVASKYLEVMRILGIPINLTKSLQSNIGVFEFAKRLVTVSGPIQGVPLALLQGARYNISVLLEFLRGFGGEVRLSQVLRLLGFGYRVLGSSGTLKAVPGRAMYSRILAHQPGLTASSPSTWGGWYSLVRPVSISSVWAILYRLIKIAKPVPDTGRLYWQEVLNLPENMPDQTYRTIEVLFEDMFNRISKADTDTYNDYIKDLETMTVPMNDMEIAVDYLVPLFKKAPVGNQLLTDWETLTTWTDYQAEEPTMNTTPSEMMMIVYRESEYSHLLTNVEIPSMAGRPAGVHPWGTRLVDGPAPTENTHGTGLSMRELAAQMEQQAVSAPPGAFTMPSSFMEMLSWSEVDFSLIMAEQLDKLEPSDVDKLLMMWWDAQNYKETHKSS